MIKHQLEVVGFCPPFCQSLIGTKYGKSMEQVITRWLIKRDTVDNLKRISAWEMGV